MLNHPDLHQTKYVEKLKNFSIGGASGIIATLSTLPIDYTKVHMQCQSEGKRGARLNPLSFAKEIYRTKGISEFYSGATSAVARQAVYATIRLGLYKNLVDSEKQKIGSDNIPFWKKFFCSTVAGGIGALAGNPFDIALIRMQADSFLPLKDRRNYRGATNAMLRIAKEEGVWTYWRASTPTVLRACALNFGMLVPYDMFKEILDDRLGYSPMNRVYCSFLASIFACLNSLPFDNVKVKCQKMAPDTLGHYPYRGFSDCCIKTLKNEGISGFYAGFSVYVARVGPNVVITLLTLDFLHSIFG